MDIGYRNFAQLNASSALVPSSSPSSVPSSSSHIPTSPEDPFAVGLPILKAAWNHIIELDRLYSAPVGSQTYGFVTFEGLAMILLELGIGPHDRLLDLGAGVGNTLVAASLLFRCQADGVELRESLVTAGLELLKEIACNAQKAGISMGTARLKLGDLQYLDRQKALKKLVQQATIILIVDEKFDEALRQFIIKTISELGSPGCKILTCLPVSSCHRDRPSARLPHDPLHKLGNCSSVVGQDHPSIPPNSLFSWTERAYLFKTEVLAAPAASSCSSIACKCYECTS